MSDLYGVPQGGGLMGMFTNPQTAGLLGMAQGLLAASAPSRLPVTNGMALGSGMQGLQQGYGNALQMQRQMIGMQALNSMLGGGAPGQSLPQAQPMPPVTGPANVAGLSGPSAGMGSFAPPTPISQAPASPSGPGIYGKTPQQLFQQGMMMNVAGIPGGGDLMKIAVEHDPTLAMQMPTDVQRNAAAAYGFGTPEYLNALQGTVRKEGIVPLRPGAGYIDNGVLKSTPGAAPAGFMNVPDSNSPTGWSVAALPGGTGAVKDSAAASSIGKAYGGTTTGFDDSGNPVFVNSGALADKTAGNGGGLFGGSNGRFGAGGAGGVSNATGVRPSLGPAEQAAQSAMGQKSADQYAAELQSAGGFGTRMFNLQKAFTGLQNADTGPGSDTVNTARSFLMAHGPQALQSLGIVDPNKIQSYDEANKYLTQYAMNQAGALGEGTDAKLATTLSGNANTHISNLAAQDVVKANMALERMNQAAVNSFQQTGLSPSKYSAWKAQFASRVDPRVFAWDTLDADKKQAAYKSMNDAQRKQFTAQYNWALQNGFIGQ